MKPTKKNLVTTPVLNGSQRKRFIENLTSLFAGGLDLLTSIETIGVESRDKKLKNFAKIASDELNNGVPFWRVAEKNHLFSGHALSLIHIGEQTGRLSENLSIVSEQMARERQFRQKIQQALQYPAFVFFITLVVGSLVAAFVLPNLWRVFSQFNYKLPLITRVIIGIGAFFAQYGSIVIPATLGFSAIIIYLFFYAPGSRFIGQTIMLDLPIIGRMLRDTELARWGYLMNSLLEATIPIDEALEAVEQTTELTIYKEFYRYLRDQINNGQTFFHAFTTYHDTSNILPFASQQLISSGERSGKLPESFKRMNIVYQAEFETRAASLGTLLEPAILVIVWLGVATLAIGVILPIYSLVGQMSNGL